MPIGAPRSAVGVVTTASEHHSGPSERKKERNAKFNLKMRSTVMSRRTNLKQVSFENKKNYFVCLLRFTESRLLSSDD